MSRSAYLRNYCAEEYDILRFVNFFDLMAMINGKLEGEKCMSSSLSEDQIQIQRFNFLESFARFVVNPALREANISAKHAASFVLMSFC